jgi:hypothetical protein
LKTIRAVIRSGALDFSGDMTEVPTDDPIQPLEGERLIVCLGFCLKPMNPPCPSGRPNHDCHYLQNLLHSGAADIPESCQQCAIREIGSMTLKARGALYIMTSAKDILLDVFAPALNERRFSSGFFVLCRYSLRPFSVGLLASGIRGWLFPFESGDCRDYRTWLRADRGIKEEQTEIDKPIQNSLRGLLREAAIESPHTTQFEREGNVFYSQMGVVMPGKQIKTAESHCSGGDETE